MELEVFRNGSNRPSSLTCGLHATLTHELRQIEARLSAIVAEARSPDPWTSRARPSFLYVMYAMILFALPMGVLSAFSPAAAEGVSAGITSYLSGLPEELYALFGTGYLGYTAARQWGKAKGTEV